MSARVHEVESIRQHPHAENLTLVSLKDHDRELVANKKDDGKFRYDQGDLVVLFSVGAILPQYLLEEMGAWDVVKGKGTLASNRGNRVGPRKFPALDGNPDPAERFESRGALRPCGSTTNGESGRVFFVTAQRGGDEEETIPVEHGQDVSEFLGVTTHIAA